MLYKKLALIILANCLIFPYQSIASCEDFDNLNNITCIDTTEEELEKAFKIITIILKSTATKQPLISFTKANNIYQGDKTDIKIAIVNGNLQNSILSIDISNGITVNSMSSDNMSVIANISVPSNFDVNIKPTVTITLKSDNPNKYILQTELTINKKAEVTITPPNNKNPESETPTQPDGNSNEIETPITPTQPDGNSNETETPITPIDDPVKPKVDISIENENTPTVTPISSNNGNTCKPENNKLDCQFITNNLLSVLNGISLTENGSINGGQISGNIVGEHYNKIANLTVLKNVSLENILIGENIKFEDINTVKLKNIRFISSDVIPNNLDLTELLNLTDLNNDIVENSSILEQINTTFNLKVKQNQQKLSVILDNVRYAITPLQIIQTDKEPDIYFTKNKLNIITNQGRKIIAQPIIQQQSEFEKIIDTSLKFDEIGNYYIQPNSYISANISIEAKLTNKSLGITDIDNILSWVFLDENNEKREQFIHAMSANIIYLQNLLKDNNFQVNNDGSVSTTIDGKRATYIFHYLIEKTDDKKFSVESLNNSITEFTLTYPNGDKQIIIKNLYAFALGT
jgi:hypothetical protein